MLIGFVNHIKPIRLERFRQSMKDSVANCHTFKVSTMSPVREVPSQHRGCSSKMSCSSARSAP
jgi:hypothetical protein